MAPPPSKYVHFTVCLFCLAWPLLLASPIHRTPGVTQNSPREAKGDQTVPQEDQTVPKNDQTVPQEVAMDTTAYQKVNAHKSSDIVSHQNLRLPRYPCSTSRDCYPKDNVNDTIPAKYVNCTDNTCECNGCFYGLNDSCAIEACHRFRYSSQECVDERKSQKKVFLLSVFLSSLGVANTYIGQNTLGGIQVAVLVLGLLSCVCIYCTKKWFIECCSCFEEECDCCDCCEDFWGCCQDFGSIMCILFAIITIFLCCIAIASWWVADLVAFIQNTRIDGNGCPLRYDL